MKRKFLQLCLISGLLSFGSCVQGDIDDLEDRMDDLTEQVSEMEKAQQDALLDQIAILEALIADLQADNSELSDDYAALLVNLQILEDEVANNASAVYYGNLVTDADFVAVLSQGATIVTGKVVATNQTHVDALAAVKLIGGSLSIHGGIAITLPVLENVAGSLEISDVVDVDAAVSFPVLASIGNDLRISNNDALVSVDAPELVLIYNDFATEQNSMLSRLTMAKLDAVASINMSEYVNDMPSNISDLDLSSVNVDGDVRISGIGEGAMVMLGVIEGDLVYEHNAADAFEILNETFDGDFNIADNSALYALSLPNLTSINGYFNVSGNLKSGGGFGPMSVGVKAITLNFDGLSAFDNLVFIGGDVNVTDNNFTSLDAFNSVTEVQGRNITVRSNGGLTHVNVFNSLVATGVQSTRADISISEKTDWFNGFEMLPQANKVRVTFQQIQVDWVPSGVCKVDGFNALTSVRSINMDVSEIKEFNAFPVLSTFSEKWNPFIDIYLPIDREVGLCSMETLLTAIKNGDYTSSNPYGPVFWDPMDGELDTATGVDQLLAPCI